MPKRVLVVDDDALYASLVREIFTSKGHSVLTASNGAEALEVLKSQSVDLIVSDLEMPIMNGLELHSKILLDPRLKSAQFVFLSGPANRELLDKVRQRPGTLLVYKTDLVSRLMTLSDDLAKEK